MPDPHRVFGVAGALLAVAALAIAQSPAAPPPVFVRVPPVPSPPATSVRPVPTPRTGPYLEPRPAANASVREVVDGDTLRLEVAGSAVTVRLLGVDSPELHRPGTPVECFAREARDRLAAWLPRGSAVHLSVDEETRDRYGRLLGYLVRASDGLLVNAALARHGLADELAFAPNLHYADHIAGEVRAARAEGRGLWGACAGPHVPA